MPKTDIDYSNTIIYKITCRDKVITDVYVGHTTNFVQRKHSHKQTCKAGIDNCKLYQVMRANGGWENWQMEIINFFNCADHYAARIKEQEYFISLGATLNSIEPLPKPKVFISNDNIIVKPTMTCITCHVNCSSANGMDKHNKTVKHKKLLNLSQKENITIITKNFTDKYTCVLCHIKCSRQAEWDRHILTNKHAKKQLGNKLLYHRL